MFKRTLDLTPGARSLSPVPRYRITKPIPDVLGYRDGKVYFQDYYAGGKLWVWYVRREVISNSSVELCTAEDALKLEQMRQSGVTVRKDSQAEAVLRSLVRKGYAERLAD